MIETSQSKISGIVAEMKGIEAQLSIMSNWDDKVGEFMKFQFVHMKRELLKELLIELIKSDENLVEMDEAFFKFVAYLSNQAKSEHLSPEIRSSIREAEGLVATI
ncbi:MAG TPA: hypothetical protein PK228_12055 [Saprospiraceae bacterium]|nr:hypothetical protein [Saprospiraceae bacterium]